MNEREELQRAREELKSSIKVVQKNLKIFGKAVVSSKKAILRNVGNNIINTYKQLQSDIYIHKLNKEIAHYQKEREAAIKRAKALEEANRRARDREHTRVLEAEARRIKNQEREERVLKFKNGVKQKTSSLKSKIGKVKNSFLRTLSSKNIDVKLRDAFDKVGIVGLTVLGSGLTMVNRGKERITDFTSSQIAKLAEYVEFVVGNNDLDFYKFLNENGGLPDVITCCRFSLHDAQPLKDSLMDLSTSNEAGAVYNTYLFAGRGLQNDRGRVQRGAGV